MQSGNTLSGTSRRSHTKSRKGCTTCKRRHIRCDETFPQCRNCTKHQVRCDYMDLEPREETPDRGRARSSAPSPDIDSLVSEWQSVGAASLGDLSLDLKGQSFNYSATDLKMVYYVMRAGQSAESQEFTVWTNSFSQGFTIAQRHPFLMHALFAFTAFSIAFDNGSVEAKGLAYQYGGVALQGLQDAISHFSAQNADAVLLASRLLAWQANDWRSWVSLTSGIRTVVNSMQSLPNDSLIQHVIEKEDAAIPHGFPASPQASMSEAYHGHYAVVLQNCSAALEELAVYLEEWKLEAKYIDQLRDYVHRLAGVRPAVTLEEQFNHLYALRKWIFYVPAILLRRSGREAMALLVIAHFYAVALSMDDLFPAVAPVLLSALASAPLKETVAALDAHARSGQSSPWDVSAFPRNVLSAHISRDEIRRSNMPSSVTASSFEGIQQQLAYSIGPSLSGHRSPAFGHFPMQQTTPSYSSAGSSFLEVPTLSNEPSQKTSYGIGLSMEPEDVGYDLDSGSELPGGFVPSPSQALWT